MSALCFPLFSPFFFFFFFFFFFLLFLFSSPPLPFCRRDVSTHCTTWACLCMKVFTFSHPRILLTFLSLFCTHPSSQHPKPVPDPRAHKSCTRTWWGSQDSLSLNTDSSSLPLCPWILLFLLASFGSIYFHPKFPLFSLAFVCASLTPPVCMLRICKSYVCASGF